MGVEQGVCGVSTHFFIQGQQKLPTPHWSDVKQFWQVPRLCGATQSAMGSGKSVTVDAAEEEADPPAQIFHPRLRTE